MILRIPGIPVPNSRQQLALAGMICLIFTGPAHGAWNILGLDPNDPGVESDGRAGDGAVFTVPGGYSEQPDLAFTFTVDSSIDQNKWWVSHDPSAWLSQVTNPPSQQGDPDRDDFLGMRIDEPIPDGGGFYAGMSYSVALTELTHSFRIRYGDANQAVPPDGTRIYLGYGNLGGPAGITEDEIRTGGGNGLLNAVMLANIHEQPPASAFPTEFVNSFTWLAFEQEMGYVSGVTGPDDENTSTRILVDAEANQPITEMVVVVVLPDGESFPFPANPDDRMHFSWTFDGEATSASGAPNPNSGTILVPEPGRTMLLGLAFALLLLRRSRLR